MGAQHTDQGRLPCITPMGRHGHIRLSEKKCTVRSRWLILFILVGSSLALWPGWPAAAYETWCADDPLVAVDGRLLDIQVQMPLQNVATMRATTLTVVIPSNVAGSVLVDDVSAFSMQTRVVASAPAWDGRGPLPITVIVDVTATVSYPIRAVITPLTGAGVPLAAPIVATGTANTRLMVPFTLPPR
ncbi:MAG: hypothetical protein C4290_00305 [Chloroflexota bacterium]